MMIIFVPILAPRRSLCHASFGGGGRIAAARSGRRVMGGAKINHGHWVVGERKRSLFVWVCGSYNFAMKGNK